MVLAIPIELEMGLPGHHLLEIKSTQIDVEQGKCPTSFKKHVNYIWPLYLLLDPFIFVFSQKHILGPQVYRMEGKCCVYSFLFNSMKGWAFNKIVSYELVI